MRYHRVYKFILSCQCIHLNNIAVNSREVQKTVFVFPSMLIVRSLVILLIVSVVSYECLKCYECDCNQSNLSKCECDRMSDSDDDTYCVIFETRYTESAQITMTRIERNSTYVYIKDPYYILLQESIQYRVSTKEWFLMTNGAVFGCDWDLCNAPGLINVLPDSFKLTIDKTWLDTNIYGTGSVTDCYHCPNETCSHSTCSIDVSRCSIITCTNADSVKFDRTISNQHLNHSFCLPCRLVCSI
jgi:hypothetical protein